MNVTLGELIKKTRKKLKMTQADLAKKIGKKTITIRKYESNEINPSIEVLEKIAQVLEIGIWDLLAASMTSPANIADCISDEDRDFLSSLGYIKNNKLIPIPFDEMKSKVDEMFPALQAEINFLSNPNVEKVFNYSFNDLSRQGGYQELLILAIEKAIRSTLEDIQMHLDNGDIFDGVGSWISKDSPLYEIIKNNTNV